MLLAFFVGLGVLYSLEQYRERAGGVEDNSETPLLIPKSLLRKIINIIRDFMELLMSLYCLCPKYSLQITQS